VVTAIVVTTSVDVKFRQNRKLNIMSTAVLSRGSIAAEEGISMPRGRRPKALKPPTKLERSERLRDAIVGLPDELVAQGFGSLLPPPGALMIEDQELDPKTDGYTGKAKEPLGVYIQRVSIKDNFSQRPPFDHAMDPIYRRLIRDFIGGALMPEAKVAALSKTSPDQKAQNLDDAGDITFSVIDGLQRLYCFNIALLLVLMGEEAVNKGLIPLDAWNYFSDVVPDREEAPDKVRELLARKIRYEVFFKIDLAGLLHYMVTFNTGQRRMSLPVQLEIMQRPLLEELERAAKITIAKDISKMPGATTARGQFSAADLILGVQAFLTHNPQVSANEEAEKLMNTGSQALDNMGDIKDVSKTFRIICNEMQTLITKVYADDATHRYVLSGGKLFLIGLAASCGYLRQRGNMKILEGALDKVIDMLKKGGEDPLNLDEYQEAQASITTSRGKGIRRLVYDTFNRFFSGATVTLEWADTAASITGNAHYE